MEALSGLLRERWVLAGLIVFFLVYVAPRLAFVLGALSRLLVELYRILFSKKRIHAIISAPKALDYWGDNLTPQYLPGSKPCKYLPYPVEGEVGSGAQSDSKDFE